MATNRGNPEGNIANLKPAKAGERHPGMFKKGEPSRNPHGRPVMSTLITSALREKLAEMDAKTRQSFAARIADLLLKCATEPDPELDKTRLMAINEIIDRCEGKPKQQLDVNDVTADLRSRSDQELMYHLEHGHFPGESVN